MRTSTQAVFPLQAAPSSSIYAIPAGGRDWKGCAHFLCVEMIFNNHIVQRIEWEKGRDKLQYGALCEIEWWIWHVTQAARVGRRRALSLVPHTPLPFPTAAAPVAHTASPWLVHQALDYLTTRGVLYQNTWAGSNTQKTCVHAQKGKSNTQILNSRMRIFSHHLKYQYNSPKCPEKKNPTVSIIKIFSMTMLQTVSTGDSSLLADWWFQSIIELQNGLCWKEPWTSSSSMLLWAGTPSSRPFVSKLPPTICLGLFEENHIFFT